MQTKQALQSKINSLRMSLEGTRLEALAHGQRIYFAMLFLIIVLVGVGIAIAAAAGAFDDDDKNYNSDTTGGCTNVCGAGAVKETCDSGFECVNNCCKAKQPEGAACGPNDKLAVCNICKDGKVKNVYGTSDVWSEIGLFKGEFWPCASKKQRWAILTLPVVLVTIGVIVLGWAGVRRWFGSGYDDMRLGSDDKDMNEFEEGMESAVVSNENRVKKPTRFERMKNTFRKRMKNTSRKNPVRVEEII